jgi:hypothetical protein
VKKHLPSSANRKIGLEQQPKPIVLFELSHLRGYLSARQNIREETQAEFAIGLNCVNLYYATVYALEQEDWNV